VNDQQRVFLGHSTFSDITFKRGTTDDVNFWEWLSELFGNKPISRRNANIITFNQAGDIMKSWTLIGAIPIAWKSSDLQADGSGVVIEELTLAFEGLKAGKKGGGGNKTKRTATGEFSSF
jgi:phage tail-like protein